MILSVKDMLYLKTYSQTTLLIFNNDGRLHPS